MPAEEMSDKVELYLKYGFYVALTVGVTVIAKYAIDFFASL